MQKNAGVKMNLVVICINMDKYQHAIKASCLEVYTIL